LEAFLLGLLFGAYTIREGEHAQRYDAHHGISDSKTNLASENKLDTRFSDANAQGADK
jgi:hypothetical protein